MSLSDEQLYSMMISQLQEDGQFVAAANLASDLMLPLSAAQNAGQSLRRSVERALEYAQSDSATASAFPRKQASAPRATPVPSSDSTFDRYSGRSFQSLYSLRFQNTFQARHKRKVTLVRFSPDGNLLVTGGCDSILKLITVEDAKAATMKEYSKQPEHGLDSAHTRTLYGHFGRINDVSFHPYASLLASSSQDCTIKFFPTIRSGGQSVLDSLPTSAEIISLDWHACGVVLAATTGMEHGVRLIDVNKPNQVTVRLTADERAPLSTPPSDGSALARLPPGANELHPFYSQCRFVQDSSLLAALSGPEISFYDARTGSRRPEIVLSAPNDVFCTGMHILRNGTEFVVSYKNASSDAHKKAGSRLYDIRASLQKSLTTYPSLEASPSSMAGDSVIIGISYTSNGTRPIGYLINPPSSSGGEPPSKYLFGYDNIDQIAGRSTDHTYCLSVDAAIHICDPDDEDRPRSRRQQGR